MSNALQPVTALICARVWEVCCNFPLPVASLSDSRSQRQNAEPQKERSLQCSLRWARCTALLGLRPSRPRCCCWVPPLQPLRSHCCRPLHQCNLSLSHPSRANSTSMVGIQSPTCGQAACAFKVLNSRRALVCTVPIGRSRAGPEYAGGTLGAWVTQA